jgi:hypothetical protein
MVSLTKVFFLMVFTILNASVLASNEPQEESKILGKVHFIDAKNVKNEVVDIYRTLHDEDELVIEYRDKSGAIKTATVSFKHQARGGHKHAARAVELYLQKYQKSPIEISIKQDLLAIKLEDKTYWPGDYLSHLNYNQDRELANFSDDSVIDGKRRAQYQRKEVVVVINAGGIENLGIDTEKAKVGFENATKDRIRKQFPSHPIITIRTGRSGMMPCKEWETLKSKNLKIKALLIISHGGFSQKRNDRSIFDNMVFKCNLLSPEDVRYNFAEVLRYKSDDMNLYFSGCNLAQNESLILLVNDIQTIASNFNMGKGDIYLNEGVASPYTERTFSGNYVGEDLSTSLNQLKNLFFSPIYYPVSEFMVNKGFTAKFDDQKILLFRSQFYDEIEGCADHNKEPVFVWDRKSEHPKIINETQSSELNKVPQK